MILGTVLGHLLDRLPPRNGLAACELLAAAAWALMVTTGGPGAIVALALFCGVTTGIFKIVSTAVVPMLVDDDDLDAANGSILTAQTLTRGRGVALGGALVGLTSANFVLLLNAVSFVFSGALLLAFSRVPRHAPPSPDAKQAGQPRLAGALARRRTPLPADAGAAHDHLQPAGGLGRARHLDRAIVPTLRDTYGASNFAGGRHHGARCARHRHRQSLPTRYAGYLSGMALLAIGWGGFGIAPDLLIAGPFSIDRRHRQRHRHRALPHDDATRDAAARAREHDRIRVRRDVQHDRRRSDRCRAAVERARSACDVHGRRHDLRARRPGRGAVLAEIGSQRWHPAPLEVAPDGSPVNAR